MKITCVRPDLCYGKTREVAFIYIAMRGVMAAREQTV